MSETAPEAVPPAVIPSQIDSFDESADSLLATKLHIPRLPVQHVTRPRLLALLERGVQGPVTLVMAPAGAGKTTLLAEWASTTTFPVRWLSLEAAENDPGRFLSYLIAALTPPGEHPTLLAQEDRLASSSAWEPVLIRLLNDVTRWLKQDAVVILDDCHLLTNEVVHMILRFLLEHLPVRLHVVVGTRVDPPWPLARLRARNQLWELRGEALDFVPSEVEEFARAMELNLTDEAAYLLETYTEGWIAGVQLLTLALRGKADAAGFLRQSGGMHHFLREYVSEEILGQQDAEMQNFLLHTCLLEQLCGPLCDAVRGETGSKKLLEELRKANLFVSVLDETSIWYRYHPLFAEALAAHLREQEPERIPELYLRASLWYEDQQRPEKAYEYAFLAGDFTRAVTLLEKLSPYLFERGEFLRMRQWLTQLPSELITASPLLSLASIWTHSSDQSIPGGANKAVKMLIAHLEQQIEMHAQDTESSWAELSNVLPLVRAWEALAQGNAALMITLANQISPVYTHPESALSRFIAVNRRMLLGTAYRASGNLEASEQMHLETVQSEESRADHRPSLSAAPNLVELYEARGQLRKLGQFYDNLFRETTQRTDLFPPLLALMQARSAALYYEWNQLTEAETRARQALELVERLKLPMPTIALFSRWVQMRIALVRGDNEKARTLLTQAEQHLTTNHYFPDLTKKSRDTISVRFALTNGQLEQAERWEREQGLRFDDPLPSQLSRHDYLDYVTLARILIARGRLQRNSAALVQALILLDHLRDIAASRYLHGWHRETQVLTALALQAQGKVRQALFTLGPILTQAEAEGYVRLFADEGQPMAYLLAQIADFTWASSDYIGQIQAAFVLTKWTAADLARQPFRDPLSSREQEVLRLVANGCSNQQIAQQLVISQHTVKLHIKHIFAKLMVTNRTQAVAQARELNLL